MNLTTDAERLRMLGAVDRTELSKQFLTGTSLLCRSTINNNCGTGAADYHHLSLTCDNYTSNIRGLTIIDVSHKIKS